MKTWTATTTAAAHPEAVLDVLTDPDAITAWAPVSFDVDALADERLLSASGPVAMDVEYELTPAVSGGSEVRASVSIRPGRGLTGRILAEATGALLSAGALQAALGRVAREAALAYC